MSEDHKEKLVSDIRIRDWMNLDTKVSNAAKLLISAENILTELDDFQLWNGQDYPDLEDFNLQLSEFRNKFINYIDEHKELLTMDEKVNNYFGQQNE